MWGNASHGMMSRRCNAIWNPAIRNAVTSEFRLPSRSVSPANIARAITTDVVMPVACPRTTAPKTKPAKRKPARIQAFVARSRVTRRCDFGTPASCPHLLPQVAMPGWSLADPSQCQAGAWRTSEVSVRYFYVGLGPSSPGLASEPQRLLRWQQSGVFHRCNQFQPSGRPCLPAGRAEA